MPATVHVPVLVGAPPVTRDGTARRQTPPAAARVGIVDVSRPAVRPRWFAPLQDGLWLVAVAWSVPAVVLTVGIPIALAIVFLLWAGRSALGAL